MRSEIVSICDCIDHCFAYTIWCDDIAQIIQGDDLLAGLDRGFELVSDATRLLSFLAIRKLSDLFGEGANRSDDLSLERLGLASVDVLAGREYFLSEKERRIISKSVAHLTEHLPLEADSEVELSLILRRNLTVLLQLVAELKDIAGHPSEQHHAVRSEVLLRRAQRLLSTPS